MRKNKNEQTEILNNPSPSNTSNVSMTREHLSRGQGELLTALLQLLAMFRLSDKQFPSSPLSELLKLLPSSADAGLDKKIPFETTVPEIMLFVKVAIKAGLIADLHPMELAKRVQASTYSVGTMHISVNSLRNHYFSPSKSAAVSLISKLMKMVHVLREYQ